MKRWSCERLISHPYFEDYIQSQNKTEVPLTRTKSKVDLNSTIIIIIIIDNKKKKPSILQQSNMSLPLLSSTAETTKTSLKIQNIPSEHHFPTI